MSSAGLSTTVLPAASAGREAPAGDRHREVPRHDDADDAERLVEGDVDAAGDRDLPAEQPLRRAGVVVQARRGRCRPPSGRCRWCARSCGPRARPAPRGASSTTAAKRRSSGARSPGATSRHGRERRRARARWRRRSPRQVGERDVDDGLLGGRVDDACRCRSWRARHSLSKPRRSSQSVTAASKAASSTSAMLA